MCIRDRYCQGRIDHCEQAHENRRADNQLRRPTSGNGIDHPPGQHRSGHGNTGGYRREQDEKDQFALVPGCKTADAPKSFPVNLGGGTALSALAGSCAMQNRHGGVVRHGAPFLTRISRAGLTGTHGKSSPAQRQCVRAGLSLSGSPAPPRHVEVYDETRAMRFRTVRR